MRFRAKFGALGWCWIGLACSWVIVAVFKHNHSGSGIHGVTAALCATPGLLQVLTRLSTYWDLDSSGLHRHRLWHKREIAWEDVTHVGGFNGRPSASMLEVDYARAAPMSDRGRILANPDDRRGFIGELRKFAPQAEFEV
jgi:hypothetical protein